MATRHPGESQGLYIVLCKAWSQSFLDSLNSQTKCNRTKLLQRGKGTFYFFASIRDRPRGRSLNSRPMRSVVVIFVKHILRRVAAVQNVVANPSDGSSCGSWHSTCYHKSRSGSPQTVTEKKNVPFSPVNVQVNVPPLNATKNRIFLGDQVCASGVRTWERQERI